MAGVDASISSISINNGTESSEKNVERLVSDVWNYFDKLGSGSDGIIMAKCKACQKEYKAGGKKYGTSSLRRHIPLCKSIKFHDVGQMFVDNDGKIRSRKISPQTSREMLATAVIKHDLPFSFVEYDGIKAWIRYLNPNVPCVSRNTLVSDINRMYAREKCKLKLLLSTLDNRICLTSDVWTACTSEGYICLTAHFVDENWKLNSKILCFDSMPPPHSGVELASKVFEFLKEWRIEKKVFSLTLDNATNNDCMVDILKEQLALHDSLLCDGEFFHIRCSAHILNLIVQEGVKVISEALKKIRDSVKYVKGSEGRKKKFEECVNAVGGIDTGIGLRLDVSTRWNSTYLMLESAIKYKKAFTSLQLHDRNYKFCPSNEEWTKAEKICEFLEPFYETTNLISGSSYPTSNLYFMQVWKIQSMLMENLDNEDDLIGNMCLSMWQKFDKYWGQYREVLAFGAILDPRIKLQMLEYFYKRVEQDPSKCESSISLVKEKMYKLFAHYASATTSNSSQAQNSSPSWVQASVQSGSRMKAKGKRIIDEIREYESQTITSAGKSQLDLYLEEPKLEFTHYENLDVLDYWKNSKNRFPALAMMARDVLAIPITTVASESAFSIGARVLTKYRSCMLPEKVQALICTRNWLHGYVVDNEDNDYNTKTILSSGESNCPTIVEDDDEE